MSAADGQSDGDVKEGDALVAFLLENRTLMNYASIIMIIFAVWATVESITNALGMTWWPPETGIPAEDLYKNPDNVQNINNGWIIGLGAVCIDAGMMYGGRAFLEVVDGRFISYEKEESKSNVAVSAFDAKWYRRDLTAYACELML